MIHQHHIPHLDRLSKYYVRPMLTLGRTLSAIPEYPTGKDYFLQYVDWCDEWDMDGGDLMLDLNKDCRVSQQYLSVFNIGTLEHVWNAHNAWANCMRAVVTDGFFLSHQPINGWVGHGIHLTHPDAVRAFLTKNGFEIREQWTSRWKTQGETLWLVAQKRRHIESLEGYEPPLQVYENGRKGGIV